MYFEPPLFEARLIRRYQRFLADVELPNGAVVTAHTPNTGSMLGCREPGSRVWLREAGTRGRKYPLTWELVETAGGVLVGINTGLANRLVKEGAESGAITELQGYAVVRSEVSYGRENSRIDLLLETGGGQRNYVEVKSVTLAADRRALFPDAVTARGAKHLRELMEIARLGQRAVIFFCVQRQDVDRFQPADWIDPVYAETLRLAIASGVEALAYRAAVSTAGIAITDRLPVLVPPETSSRRR